MENFPPLPPFSISSSVNENSPLNESRPVDASNWYDDGSIATCIDQTTLQTQTNDIDLLSPRNINDDEFIETSMSATNRLYTLENDDVTLTDEFHCSSTVDPFGFNQNNNNSSIMITDLDDLLIDDELDDESQKKTSSNLLNTNFRRPIQEDILYEVEHENSYSDYSPNNSIVIPTEDNTSSKIVLESSHQASPIYALPPLYTPAEKPSSSSLQINTNTHSFLYPYSDVSSSFLTTTYTPKIRHRHFSVGSYYDNKTTTVAIHPNHTLYIIGSAPVSPINRTTTTTESNYHLLHHSPVAYPPTTLNTLRHLNPYLESNYDYPRTTEQQHQRVRSLSPPPSPVPALEREAPIVRPKTSRGRVRSSPPTPPSPPPRVFTQETESTQNFYQEIDNPSTDDDQLSASRNDDLQFIRGTIERVFDFHGESASESSTNYEVISEEIKDDESLSLTESSKKEPTAYPAVQAVQRFYDTKSPSESEQKISPKQTIDENNASPNNYNNQSSTSSKLYSRSHPANQRKNKDASKSSDNEQASSEEIDDTLNDIEDDDYQDEKLRRQATTTTTTTTTTTSSTTSNENSPVHSFNQTNGKKKTSQETQTMGRPKPIIVTTRSPTSSQDVGLSNVPPLDIITQMVIERTDGIDDGRITEISGDMIIYYDDIEIVEHSSDISTTESDTTSSATRSLKISKSVPTIIESRQPPPPIPARTLKPLHLMNTQQQSPSKTVDQPPTKANRIYELEKATIRKKFDVNTVNNILNRTDYFTGPTVTHRHPSARHFVGKLNSEDSSSRNSSIASIKPPSTIMAKSQTLPLQPNPINGHSTSNQPVKSPICSSSTVAINGKQARSTIADTNALVKQIRNSLSRNSLHDSNLNQPLSVSTKDLRTFVSSTYSPSDENIMDDDGIIHVRNEKTTNFDEQTFKRQARLSKSFHNVSEYSSSIDQYPKKETNLPSKSVENNLNRVSQLPIRNSHIPSNFPPIIASTSFSALPQEDNARLLSMKWYTGQVSENSEICYNTPHLDHDDLLYAYISAHSNRETQLLLSRLQASNDIRIHAALDDIRLRVAQFDAVKSAEDVHVFMRYLESRLRDIGSKNMSVPSTARSSQINGQKPMSNGDLANGFHRQQSDTISMKSRTSSIGTGLGKDTPPLRQMGRQYQKSSGNLAGGSTNEHPLPPPPPLPPTAPPRRGSQSSVVNQENPQVFDEMLNTVLGLQKKGAYPSSTSLQNREKSAPLIQTQMTSNTTIVHKNGRDVGKRLFESGTYKDPRLIYDGAKKIEKEEEQPLETSV